MKLARTNSLQILFLLLLQPTLSASWADYRYGDDSTHSSYDDYWDQNSRYLQTGQNDTAGNETGTGTGGPSTTSTSTQQPTTTQTLPSTTSTQSPTTLATVASSTLGPTRPATAASSTLGPTIQGSPSPTQSTRSNTLAPMPTAQSSAPGSTPMPTAQSSSSSSAGGTTSSPTTQSSTTTMGPTAPGSSPGSASSSTPMPTEQSSSSSSPGGTTASPTIQASSQTSAPGSTPPTQSSATTQSPTMAMDPAIQDCISLLVLADANRDNYLDAAQEYVQWIDRLAQQEGSSSSSSSSYAQATFQTLPGTLQELFITNAATFSTTDDLDIHGAAPGTTPTSVEQGNSLEGLCEEAIDILLANDTNTTDSDRDETSTTTVNVNTTTMSDDPAPPSPNATFTDGSNNTSPFPNITDISQSSSNTTTDSTTSPTVTPPEDISPTAASASATNSPTVVPPMDSSPTATAGPTVPPVDNTSNPSPTGPTAATATSTTSPTVPSPTANDTITSPTVAPASTPTSNANTNDTSTGSPTVTTPTATANANDTTHTSPTFTPGNETANPPTAADNNATSPSPTVSSAAAAGSPTAAPMANGLGNIWDLLVSTTGIELFRNGLQEVNVDKLLMDPAEKFTVLAPVDSVVRQDPKIRYYSSNVVAWSGHLTEILENHIVPDSSFVEAELFNGVAGDALVTLAGESVALDKDAELVGGHSLTTMTTDQISANGVLHLLDGLLAIDRLSLSLIEILEQGLGGGGSTAQRRRNLQEEFATVLDILASSGLIADPMLRDRAVNGTTFVVPSNAALVDYVGDETSKDTLLYHILPRNLYAISLGEESAMLVKTGHPTADMWVSRDGTSGIQFNDVRAENEVLGQNGVLQVVDTLLEPPSVLELLRLANELGALSINLMDFVLQASATNDPAFWELLGNGGRVTLFVPVDAFLTDNSRLAQWRLLGLAPGNLHLRDFLTNILVERPLTRDEMQALASGGTTLLPTIGMENITVEVGSGGVITVGGESVLDPSMSATNGEVHFVSSVPLPPSMTSSLLDVFVSNNTSLMSLIEATGFDDLLSRTLPATFFAPPYDILSRAPITDLPKALENHLFEELYYGEQMLEMDGQVITSISGKNWVISVLDGSIFLQEEEGGSVVTRVQSPLNVLGNNGVLHTVDTLLTSDFTLAPTPATYTPPFSAPTPTTYIPPFAAPTAGSSPTIPLATPSATAAPTVATPTSAAPTASRGTVATAAPTTNSSLVRVNASFVIYNTDGLTSAHVSLPENAVVLDLVFKDFVKELVADIQNPQEQQRHLRVGLNSRRLATALEPDSAKLFGVRDVLCPKDETPPVPDNANCQTLYGRYDLAVSDENPDAVHDKYAEETVKAMDDGKLQESLQSTAPNSPFTVVGAEKENDAPPEDDKMPWWLILIIVLACVLGCCCIAVAVAFFVMSSNKKDDELDLEEKLMDPNDTLPDTPPRDPNNTVGSQDEDLEDSDVENDPRSPEEQADSAFWEEEESTVNEVHEEQHQESVWSEEEDDDSEPEDNMWEEEHDDSDDDVERSAAYPMPQSFDGDSDEDTENVEAQPYWDDESKRDDWLGDDATAQVEESVAGTVDEKDEDPWEDENDDESERSAEDLYRGHEHEDENSENSESDDPWEDEDDDCSEPDNDNKPTADLSNGDSGADPPVAAASGERPVASARSAPLDDSENSATEDDWGVGDESESEEGVASMRPVSMVPPDIASPDASEMYTPEGYEREEDLLAGIARSLDGDSDADSDIYATSNDGLDRDDEGDSESEKGENAARSNAVGSDDWKEGGMGDESERSPEQQAVPGPDDWEDEESDSEDGATNPYGQAFPAASSSRRRSESAEGYHSRFLDSESEESGMDDSTVD